MPGYTDDAGNVIYGTYDEDGVFKPDDEQYGELYNRSRQNATAAFPLGKYEASADLSQLQSTLGAENVYAERPTDDVFLDGQWWIPVGGKGAPTDVNFYKTFAQEYGVDPSKAIRENVDVEGQVYPGLIRRDYAEQIAQREKGGFWDGPGPFALATMGMAMVTAPAVAATAAANAGAGAGAGAGASAAGSGAGFGLGTPGITSSTGLAGAGAPTAGGFGLGTASGGSIATGGLGTTFGTAGATGLGAGLGAGIGASLPIYGGALAGAYGAGGLGVNAATPALGTAGDLATPASQTITGGVGGGAGAAVGPAGSSPSPGGPPPAGGSPIERILAGTGTPADWAQLGITGLGVAQGFQDASNIKDSQQLARDYFNYAKGVADPAIARNEATYQPGFDITKGDPSYQAALDQSAKASARAQSVGTGNPYGDPGAQFEIEQALNANLALPWLDTYRGRQLQQMNLGVGAASGASTNAINTAAVNPYGAAWGAAGAGAGNLFNTPSSQAATNSQLQNAFKLFVAGSGIGKG